MSIIKLDWKRSVDDRFYYQEDGITYYQINNSNELCVCRDNTDRDNDILEKISVTPGKRGSYRDKTVFIPAGDYRVTTMLININDDSYNRFCIHLPSFIERFYYSDDYVNSIKRSEKLDIIFTDNHPFCHWNDFQLSMFGFFSKDKKELFRYRTIGKEENGRDVELPDGLQTIHNYAFMFAEIGTLLIPASVREIGKKAFLNAKINNIVFEGKWTAGIDPKAFSGMEYIGGIRINDTAQNISSYNNLLEAVDNDCRKLTLSAPSICQEDSPAIGYIRVTQIYYSDGYITRWNDIRHNEGIIDINTRHIVSVKEYKIPTYIPVTGSIIMLHGANNDHQHYCYIVYEPVEIVLQKIDIAVKQLNASGCTVDELIDRIQNKIK